jgi:hypothetical protein
MIPYCVSCFLSLFHLPHEKKKKRVSSNRGSSVLASPRGRTVNTEMNEESDIEEVEKV